MLVLFFFAVFSLMLDGRLHCMVNKNMDGQWITFCFNCEMNKLVVWISVVWSDNSVPPPFGAHNPGHHTLQHCYMQQFTI